VTGSANVELVRSIYADWERGDFGSVDWADPEIEWVMVDGPTPGRRTGSSAATREFGDFLRAWEQLYIEGQGVRELDDARVLGVFQFGGRGKSSGVEIAEIRSDGAHVFYMQNGKVVRIDAYWDRDRALADLGLAPEVRSDDTQRPG
jgi:ketosteroid isomerase-like protein